MLFKNKNRICKGNKKKKGKTGTITYANIVDGLKQSNWTLFYCKNNRFSNIEL